ncbi:MAG TPA: polysaccharide biosynthesis/export family protein [Pirellulales bacterium]|nr:polysaccharide biosynthesis/export family protein [Pirellulales bacterium]
MKFARTFGPWKRLALAAVCAAGCVIGQLALRGEAVPVAALGPQSEQRATAPAAARAEASGPWLSRDDRVRLCQALGPAPSGCRLGVDCADGHCGCQGRELTWRAERIIPFQSFAQGEYCGVWRSEHVPEYRLRVDDQLEFVYRLTREESNRPYEINVGDEVRVESFTDEKLNRDLIVQPDGTITLRLLGQVRATHRTVTQLRDDIEKRYTKYYKIPSITVTPLKVNTKLEDLRATVDSRQGSGGQHIGARVTPEGTISLPALVSVPVQGLSLPELKRELDERYAHEVEGIEVTPILTARAPRYVYVLGEVTTSGRFSLEGPTTVTQAIALAGGWKIGANLRQIVIFRRAQDWHLMATMLNLQGELHSKKPCPADEIWLDDSDIVIVPKSPIQRADDFIEMVFTRGFYGVFPAAAAGTNGGGITHLGTF